MPDVDDSQIKRVVAQLPEDEYRELVKRATALGLTPNDYLRKALFDEAFFEDEIERGGEVLIKRRGLVRPVDLSLA